MKGRMKKEERETDPERTWGRGNINRRACVLDCSHTHSCVG